MTICIMALLLAVGACASYAEGVDGRTVLRNMLEAEGKVAYTAHQITTLAKGPALTSEQTIYRDGYRGMRTEYIAPPPLKGEIMADDGRMLAHLIPNAKVLKMRPSRLMALKMRTDQAEHAFGHGDLKVELVGRDRIAGRTAYVVEVRPVHRSRGQTRKFWVDAEKWIKLKTEDIGPDGAVASMSYFTRIDFVDSIPNEKFHIEPPPGVRVERETGPALLPLEKAQQAVRFRILKPSYVPSGYKLAGTSLFPFREGKVVALRYTDGVTSFSLFQAPGRMLDRKFLERLHDGPVRPGRGIYSWREDGLNLTIVGQLPEDQMRKVAASVK
jgi:negative regulator of sigma E activity